MLSYLEQVFTTPFISLAKSLSQTQCIYPTSYQNSLTYQMSFSFFLYSFPSSLPSFFLSFFFFFSFYGEAFFLYSTCSIWKFLGQGSNGVAAEAYATATAMLDLSHICDPCHHSNAGSINQ